MGDVGTTRQCPCAHAISTPRPHTPTLLFHAWERALVSPETEPGSSTNTLREDNGISIPWMGLRSDHVAWPTSEHSFSPFSVAEKTEPKNKGKKRQKKPKTERHTGT